MIFQVKFFQKKSPFCKNLALATLATILQFLSACDGANKPLDAQTRRAIDSTAAVRIREMRQQMDSLCQQQQATVLPRLVDSIRREREREIQEALKNVPK